MERPPIITEPDTAPTPEAAAPAAPRVAEIRLPDPLPIGQHTFEYLCGTAGTGKTTMARALAEQDPGVQLCATTGIAAVNLGEGTTINALLRYFNTDDMREKYTRGMLQTQLRKLRRAGLTRLLLDEVSMMGADQLTYLTRAVLEVNADADAQAAEQADQYDDDAAAERTANAMVELPPLGITLVGDFGQLPPVPDLNEATGKKLPVKFAFESPEWRHYAGHVTRLEKIWRQDNLDFVRALHAVRRGDVTTALAFFTPDRFSATTDDTFAGSTVLAKNAEVDRYNELRMDELTGDRLHFETVRKGKQRGDWKQIPDVLSLREGALVMLLSNRRIYEDEDDSLGTIVHANGDLATLLGPSRGAGGWSVRLHRNDRTVVVYPLQRENVIPVEPGRKKAVKEEICAALKIAAPADNPEAYYREWDGRFTEDGKYEVLGSVFYMPMRAAYGCTVHKTQGLTLDEVQVNIRDPFFRHPGMLFVALSRCRTAKGLRIVGDQRGFIERMKVEPKVQPWL